jgi:hypothetical protein
VKHGFHAVLLCHRLPKRRLRQGNVPKALRARPAVRGSREIMRSRATEGRGESRRERNVCALEQLEVRTVLASSEGVRSYQRNEQMSRRRRRKKANTARAGNLGSSSLRRFPHVLDGDLALRARGMRSGTQGSRCRSIISTSRSLRSVGRHVLPQHPRAVAQGEPALGVVAHADVKASGRHDLVAEGCKLPSSR